MITERGDNLEVITGVLNSVLAEVIELAILMFEYIGVGIIVWAGIKGLYNYLTHEPKTRLLLAEQLAIGLEFKLASEILRTVVVRSLSEIALVAGIIALRGTLTLLLHWEIKNEKHDLEVLKSGKQE